MIFICYETTKLRVTVMLTTTQSLTHYKCISLTYSREADYNPFLLHFGTISDPITEPENLNGQRVSELEWLSK